MILTSEEGREYGKRSRPARRMAGAFMVEGKLYNNDTLAKELGVCTQTAERKMRLAQKQPKPITLELLRQTPT